MTIVKLAMRIVQFAMWIVKLKICANFLFPVHPENKFTESDQSIFLNKPRSFIESAKNLAMPKRSETFG